MEKSKFKAKISQISETAALVEFGRKISEDINKKVRTFCTYLDEKPFYGMVEYVPAFTSVSVIYNPLDMKSESPYEVVKVILDNIISKLDFSLEDEEHIVEIPVCYGGEFGQDIEQVAKINNITVDEVIKIHSEGKYLVYMIGFAPGFPYLGGMSEKIAAPRRESPRIAIPAGSVGIAGMQTGVYPIETPGGWQLIGKTPLKLFDLKRNSKSLLKAGDIVKFYPISYEEYVQLKEEE
ncbi:MULTISPECIES: 5-oxoprolinase subunit PxpB [Clostridium]|uniref:5-oxoprolinase subunit PxpB n=1 Tax=Clostridium beijerinckii TaxID=1520 RepID=A0AAW3W381_CLOBE|nr:MULTISPECIES: 5-oxoprolinase subunit PxpB [Clostridium]MBC2456894.1 5-oxoprolinase subunit PxpB [Clostridium beijerinckii]MBC2473366.1 5-oxoprolinase subunit PxpB [Clostridium beijerinckii]MDG5853200.1 5-oxoprolinase subunit PxpB [Clostridium beijerinckii]NOV60324.1 inhibitor of KinA [Clostridium beijerinckii]NOV70900.1 inhibitor of KinA [Clostridium beijerinckii]